jgi:hypothetical protein
MTSARIGLLQESTLHAQIKEWYGKPSDKFEEQVGDYRVDIARDNMLIEIQLGHFQKIREKLGKLLADHQVRVVLPIPVNKWIIRYDISTREPISKRKSPYHAKIDSIFNELIYMPTMPLSNRFSLEVLFIEQEDIWLNDGKGSWRRNYWSLLDRKLVKVVSNQIFSHPSDYQLFLSPNLPVQFTSQDVSTCNHIPRALSNKLVYCLARMNLIKRKGSRGRYHLYSRQDSY